MSNENDAHAQALRVMGIKLVVSLNEQLEALRPPGTDRVEILLALRQGEMLTCACSEQDERTLQMLRQLYDQASKQIGQ